MADIAVTTRTVLRVMTDTAATAHTGLRVIADRAATACSQRTGWGRKDGVQGGAGGGMGWGGKSDARYL